MQGNRSKIYFALSDLCDSQAITSVVSVKTGMQVKFIDAFNKYWYDVNTILNRAGVSPDSGRSFLESMVVNKQVDVQYFRDPRSTDPSDMIKCYHINKEYDDNRKLLSAVEGESQSSNVGGQSDKTDGLNG